MVTSTCMWINPKSVTTEQIKLIEKIELFEGDNIHEDNRRQWAVDGDAETARVC
jgi:hypothetical protein